MTEGKTHHMVASTISFQFDFDNPQQWTAHTRRDFIEGLNETLEQLAPEILAAAQEQYGVEFDGEQRLGRVHTPWINEHQTRVVFQPTVPSVLVEKTKRDTQEEHQKLQKSFMGQALFWLINKLSDRSRDENSQEIQQNILDKNMAEASARWSVGLVDPILRTLGVWVAKFSSQDVDVQVITPKKIVKLKISSKSL